MTPAGFFREPFARAVLLPRSFHAAGNIIKQEGKIQWYRIGSSAGIRAVRYLHPGVRHLTGGVLTKINQFLHGLVYPARDSGDDPLEFLDDIAWINESERMRRDALTFWNETAMNRHYKQRIDFSAAGKFIRKHSPGLSELDIVKLETLIGKDAGQPRVMAAEPVRKTAVAWDESIRTMADTIREEKKPGPGARQDESPHGMQEPPGPRCVKIPKQNVIPYAEHYAVYMRLARAPRRR
jgi:hypothetical protein